MSSTGCLVNFLNLLNSLNFLNNAKPQTSVAAKLQTISNPTYPIAYEIRDFKTPLDNYYDSGQRACMFVSVIRYP